jgi:hypothetical protein
MPVKPCCVGQWTMRNGCEVQLCKACELSPTPKRNLYSEDIFDIPIPVNEEESQHRC